jgi:Glycosyltransferase family 87
VGARGRRLLWLIIAAGTLGKLALAFATVGQPYDIASYGLVAARLGLDPLHLYSAVRQHVGPFVVSRWPYPPGYLPWVEAAKLVAPATGLPFHGVIQLPPIAADAGLAWLVQSYLGQRARPERDRLAAAALIAFGPTFWLISGYHGQLDSVAILPAVAGLMLWERRSGPPRSLPAGLLIGLGAAVKTIPALVVLALLPSARSRREGAALIGSVAALPALALAPFLVADLDGLIAALRYPGVPGLGGMSLFAQPGIARGFLTYTAVTASPLSLALYRYGAVLALAALAALAVALLRLRPAPVQAAVAIWLAFYVVSPNFLFQYAIWGLPFFLMAGHLGKAALLQVLLLAPALVLYLAPWSPASRAIPVYLGLMGVVWLVWVGALGAQLRKLVRERRADVTSSRGGSRGARPSPPAPAA